LTSADVGVTVETNKTEREQIGATIVDHPR
jgi:hypothetical protein